jgi:hypothetical protein
MARSEASQFIKTSFLYKQDESKADRIGWSMLSLAPILPAQGTP